MNPNNGSTTPKHVERLPYPRPVWTPESFEVLVELQPRIRPLPRPLLVFAIFYIHCLWPDTARNTLERWGLSSLNHYQLPWNIEYEKLSNVSRNIWFPHLLMIGTSSDDDSENEGSCHCHGLCPYGDDFEMEKEIWISLYNRLFSEAFQNPRLQIRKCPINGLGTFSRIQNLSTKYQVAPDFTVLLYKVPMSMFVALHRKGLDKIYLQATRSNRPNEDIYIPYWIGSLVNFSESNLAYLPHLQDEFFDYSSKKYISLQYVFQYTNYKESPSAKVSKICTIENNYPSAEQRRKERYDHIITDSVNITEQLTDEKLNVALGITTEVLEGCNIDKRDFLSPDQILNINEELLLALASRLTDSGNIQLF